MCTPESPVHLLRRRRFSEAHRAVETLYGSRFKVRFCKIPLKMHDVYLFRIFLKKPFIL